MAIICEIAADIAAVKGIVPSMAGYECFLPEKLAKDASMAERYLKSISYWPVPEGTARKYQERAAARTKGWYGEVA